MPYFLQFFTRRTGEKRGYASGDAELVYAGRQRGRQGGGKERRCLY